MSDLDDALRRAGIDPSGGVVDRANPPRCSACGDFPRVDSFERQRGVRGAWWCECGSVVQDESYEVGRVLALRRPRKGGAPWSSSRR